MSSDATEMMQEHTKYDRLLERAAQATSPRTIVVYPCDETSLRGAVEAAEAKLIEPMLVGPADKIRAVADKFRLDISPFEIVQAQESEEAAAKGVKLIHEAKGEVLMKGSLHTDQLMRSVTSAASGLRTARRISHAFIMDVPTYTETLVITDAAINIFPDLDAKRDIVQNAIDLYKSIGQGTPRVAILSAVETVTSKIPSTIEAAALCKMADRGQITGGILDGPLAFDNAIDPEAAAIKGIKSEVAGQAQILVVPDLEAGNMLAKNLTFLLKADAAGIVLGARVPVILTSRADLSERGWPPARWRLLLPMRVATNSAYQRRECHGHHPCRECRVLERQVRSLWRRSVRQPQQPARRQNRRCRDKTAPDRQASRKQCFGRANLHD